jgi:hypothetical protein
VARATLADSHTGWVYRSEPPRVEPPLRPDPPPAQRQSHVDNGGRVASATPSSDHVWFERSLLVMAVPVALTLTAMLVPVLWMFGPRMRRS